VTIERPKLLSGLNQKVRDQLSQWKNGIRRCTVTGGKMGPKQQVAGEWSWPASASLGTW